MIVQCIFRSILRTYSSLSYFGMTTLEMTVLCVKHLKCIWIHKFELLSGNPGLFDSGKSCYVLRASICFFVCCFVCLFVDGKVGLQVVSHRQNFYEMIFYLAGQHVICSIQCLNIYCLYGQQILLNIKVKCLCKYKTYNKK